ncbi:tetratricopeptide repeat protein [Streptomyces sp. H27-D2]|uniref:tetratricopeptide repeat protein n=1 Tax=Streptomyces sp. H27-D2 TaxID=3046304 RepID=UPI002DBAC6D9|nr:tetratricopeptide repeat protein [Streptomyces sp. H27-D2]MEC4018507.1 tetratricopeptide repeat protein [Streptomyces sp. H27-D2]
MYGKAFAPEYQGNLGSSLSVNSSYEDVLTQAGEEQRNASSDLEYARAALAVAEANRRLGRVAEAESAWRESYRAARRSADPAAMAWALWSGGTLARQCGGLPLARRWLTAAAELAGSSGDRVARGYCLAGLAETGRIQGDYAAVAELHEQLLAEGRAHGEARHMVWALEGIAQMHRNTGRYDKALAMFEEAAEIAAHAEDARGLAWALRGIADVLSVQRDPRTALELLTEAEGICRRMDLASALAYNHKMRGNVLFRAGRYEEAREVYAGALREFSAMHEPRGATLSRLGLVKSQARLGHPREQVITELDELHRIFHRLGLHHARDMVEKFRVELTGPSEADGAGALDGADGTVSAGGAYGAGGAGNDGERSGAAGGDGAREPALIGVAGAAPGQRC